MKRWPVAGFAALMVATVAAFFITQHLKTVTPLIDGVTRPKPFSDDGDGCRRRSYINFYVLNRSDYVSVYVYNSEGDRVQTVASGVHMVKPTHAHAKTRRTFYWYGRESGGQLAPDGTYYFYVVLDDQDRTVELTQDPVVIDNAPPHLVVTGVTPSQLPASGGAPATIHFTGSNGRGGYLFIYGTALTGTPKLVDERKIPFSKRSADGYTKTWDGLVHGSPAPAGTYVTALKVVNRACVTGTFPAYLPPQPGTTPHAGVTVSYLAAEPPLDPVAAGSTAAVTVQDDHQPYHWTLRGLRVTRKPLAHGSGSSSTLRVRVPGRSAGLYELSILAAGHRTVVPIVSRAATANRRVLVVLPALTWEGENPVDDTGDGFPDTLATGGPIELQRPLVDGLPSDFGGEASLLAYLQRAGMSYDLTTDVALADGTGPSLAGRPGVVFAGPETWLPAELAPALARYVQNGGRVLSLGAGSLRRTATISQTSAGLEAHAPTPESATDILRARHGGLVTGNTEAIVAVSDGLGLFNGTSDTFSGFDSFEPIVSVAAPGRIVAEAGTTTETPSIVAYRLGSGVVIEIGLPTFTASLAHNVDAKELLRRVWTILGQ